MGFLQSVAALTKEHSDEEPESHSEAVDALIDKETRSWSVK